MLDDVTPHYTKASYALNACRASLGTTLQFLLDAERHSGGSARFKVH